jgi:hypothetical protein
MDIQETIKVRFQDWDCILIQHQYGNGRIALELIEDVADPEQEYAESIAICTINLPDQLINDGEVIIKNYSENVGILEALIKANVVSQPLCYLSSGFINAPVCKLLI